MDAYYIEWIEWTKITMATFTFSPFYMSSFSTLQTIFFCFLFPRYFCVHHQDPSVGTTFQVALHFTEDIFFLQICMFWQKSLLHVLANWLQLRPMTVSSELLYRVAAGFPTGNDISAWNYTKAVANLHFINQTLFRWHVLIEDQTKLNEILHVNVVLHLSKQATFIFFGQFSWHYDY